MLSRTCRAVIAWPLCSTRVKRATRCFCRRSLIRRSRPIRDKGVPAQGDERQSGKLVTSALEEPLRSCITASTTDSARARDTIYAIIHGLLQTKNIPGTKKTRRKFCVGHTLEWFLLLISPRAHPMQRSKRARQIAMVVSVTIYAQMPHGASANRSGLSDH
jgi:DNA-directed RNA polymerase subunit K/omega